MLFYMPVHSEKTMPLFSVRAKTADETLAVAFLHLGCKKLLITCSKIKSSSSHSSALSCLCCISIKCSLLKHITENNASQSKTIEVEVSQAMIAKDLTSVNELKQLNSPIKNRNFIIRLRY